MNRARIARLVVPAILLPILASVAFASWIQGRDHHSPATKTSTSDADSRFNAAGLPPVHLDRCPTGAQLLPRPATGTNVLPDLTLTCIGEVGSSDTVALRRLGGIPTIVNLWTTSCVPCREEMPALQQVYVASAGRLRIIGVNSKDYAEGARATLNATGVTYPSVADPDDRVRVAVGSSFMPTTLFVSAQGRIVFRKVGAFADEKALRSDIAEHLGVAL